MLDGRKVSGTSFHSWAVSIDPVHVVAEKVSYLAVDDDLGPVEFRNLAYLKEDGWHQVAGLTVLAGCGVTAPNCDVSMPYSVEGSNYVVIGTGTQRQNSGEVIWTMRSDVERILKSDPTDG
jgi:hypothetical protein